MKIAAATVAMQSEHAAVTRQETHERLRAWIGNERPDFEGRGNALPPGPAPRPVVQISDAGLAAQSAEASEATAIDAAADAVENDPMLLLIRQMVEMLTGKAVRVLDAGDLGKAREEAPAPPPHAATTDAQPPAGFGVEYDYHSVHEESELTTFSAQGIVRTADGKEIGVRIDLTMARQYREQIDVSLRAGDAARQRKDPLVLNFNGSAAQLTGQRFRFDLDGDGRQEEVPLLAGGSGYLALDTNGNGKIDSGAELFGPATGAGFAELASHDEDGNGWIDENDPVFERLRVWTPAPDGNGTLATLGDRRVGALHLGHVATPFELRDAANTDLGAIRASSFYLTDDGDTGTVQEIDLSV